MPIYDIDKRLYPLTILYPCRCRTSVVNYLSKMFNALIFIVSFLVDEIFTDFYAGRISPGKFEYPKLNGWMLVEEARTRPLELMKKVSLTQILECSFY